jgi:hypothetical protein
MLSGQREGEQRAIEAGDPLLALAGEKTKMV